MLTKEKFIEIINKLQEEDEIVDNLEDAMTEYYRESGYVFRCNSYKTAIIKLLEFVLNDDIDLIDWWYHEAYPCYLENNDLDCITIYKDDDSIDGIYYTCGDVYDYLQKIKNNICEIQKISEKQFVVIVDLITSEDAAEEKINNALSIFGIDNMRESNYWTVLMELLKETIDPSEYIKWWTEAMYGYRKHGEKAMDLITVVDGNNKYVIKTPGDLYRLFGGRP